MEIHWHLSEGDFFEGLSKEKQEFISLAKRRSVAKNAYVFMVGDPGNSAFYLESGFIKIFRTSPLGKEPIVFIRKAGELLGLAEVMTGGERKCHAQAICSSQLLEIKKEDFELILSRHFVLAKRVMAVLGRRLRFLGEQIENLMASDVATRVLKLLVYLCYEGLLDSSSWNRPIKVPVRLTQEEIASLTGSCQQTVSEVLGTLKEEGLIVVSKREIILIKPKEAISRVF
ncbi:MAG: Crp/Fnr family transcriptional regulator [bacterium]